MRAVQLLSLLLQFLLLPVLVAAEMGNISDTLGKLPSCALDCFYDTMSASPCEKFDQGCLCLDITGFTSEIVACAHGRCSVVHVFETQNVLERSCGVPERDMRPMYRVSTWIGLFLTTLVVGLRLCSKIFALGFRSPTLEQLWWDDYNMAGAYILAVPLYLVVIYYLLPNGMGKDIWTLTPAQIDAYNFGSILLTEPLYFGLYTLVKNSILFFFVRIFCRNGQSARYTMGCLNLRWTLWATIVVNSMVGVLFILLCIFQCKPISFIWTSWNGEGNGVCLNNAGLAWGNAAYSIAFDCWVFCLPISQVRAMNLSLAKRIGVGSMFGVGIIVTIVSVLRLVAIVNSGTSVNSTWDDYSMAIWSVAEYTFAIIMACMPHLQRLLRQTFPRLFKTAKSTIRKGFSAKAASCNTSDATAATMLSTMPRSGTTYTTLGGSSIHGGVEGAETSTTTVTPGTVMMTTGGISSTEPTTALMDRRIYRSPTPTPLAFAPDISISRSATSLADAEQLSGGFRHSLRGSAVMTATAAAVPDNHFSSFPSSSSSTQLASDSSTPATGLPAPIAPATPTGHLYSPEPQRNTGGGGGGGGGGTRPPLSRRLTPDFFQVRAAVPSFSSASADDYFAGWSTRRGSTVTTHGGRSRKCSISTNSGVGGGGGAGSGGGVRGGSVETADYVGRLHMSVEECLELYCARMGHEGHGCCGQSPGVAGGMSSRGSVDSRADV